MVLSNDLNDLQYEIFEDIVACRSLACVDDSVQK